MKSKKLNLCFNTVGACLLLLFFYACNSPQTKPMDHFIQGRVFLSDTTNNNSFVLTQTDSTDEKVMVIKSDNPKYDSLLTKQIKQLKEGQLVKIKGDRIIYKEKESANVIVVKQLKIVEE